MAKMRIRPHTLSFTILLGMLAALPPLSIDMGLPAFPAIGDSLNASSGSVGLTLSLFMAGFAIASLAAYIALARPSERSLQLSDRQGG